MKKQVSCHLTRCSDSLKRQRFELTSERPDRQRSSHRRRGACNRGVARLPVIAYPEATHQHRRPGGIEGLRRYASPQRTLPPGRLWEDFGCGTSFNPQWRKAGATQRILPKSNFGGMLSVETESTAQCGAQLLMQGRGKMPPALALPGRRAL